MATTESSRYQAVSRKARDFIHDFYEQLYVPPGIRFGYFIPREFGCLLFFTLPEVHSRHKQAPHNQGQSSFFRKLPLEVRQQIFAEFWQCAGLNRHVYLEDGDFRFALCETDHDSTDDACQTGLAHDFYPQPRVQNHPKCYIESLPSLHKSATLTITDKSTLYALFIRRHRCAIHPVYAFLPRLRTLNIALRAGAPDFLYIHGPALWRALAPATLPALRRISLWLDGHEPIQRRLLPQFRDLWTRIPPSIAHKLSVSLPVGPDGLWAWDEVEVRPWCSGSTGGTGSGVVLLPPFTPEFRVVLRGWQAFTETSAGWISRGGGGQGPGVRRVLAPGNPFEDLRLYGRGWFDEFYFAGSL
ncbi:hypothetical protein EV126DRAFT_517389 [Verticillium dahliae]|nr:hypothetical protein EV126DRAFT_517389 [Verticillium dahliae]